MKFPLSLLLIVLASIAFAPAAHATPCAANQLSLAVDNENGAFNGMSHSGTLLVLRNLGPDPCTVAGFPQLLFTGDGGTALPIRRKVPRGMHPGPVVPPVTIVPEAELTSRVTWVSGDVYPSGQCFTATALTVIIGDQKLTTSLSAHICGPAHHTTFNMTRLTPDPTATSAKRD